MVSGDPHSPRRAAALSHVWSARLCNFAQTPRVTLPNLHNAGRSKRPPSRTSGAPQAPAGEIRPGSSCPVVGEDAHEPHPRSERIGRKSAPRYAFFFVSSPFPPSNEGIALVNTPRRTHVRLLAATIDHETEGASALATDRVPSSVGGKLSSRHGNSERRTRYNVALKTAL